LHLYYNFLFIYLFCSTSVKKKRQRKKDNVILHLMFLARKTNIFNFNVATNVIAADGFLRTFKILTLNMQKMIFDVIAEYSKR
jgi:hypothetical protein